MLSKKIVVVGHSGVGKSSLVQRFVEDTFTDDFKVTIGVHLFTKEYTYINHSFKLILWDTEGTREVKHIRKSYLLGADAIIYVCDLTRPTTYKNITTQLDILKKDYPKSALIIAGNKSDLLAAGKMSEHKIEYANLDILISAKNGKNIKRLFNNVIKKMTS